ncbi:MAG TPA: hypothetical protein VED46_08615 [Alphaproteobacteria bacterium]|nr:hypothetical protein [Alphaproteobacteria bacterium]
MIDFGIRSWSWLCLAQLSLIFFAGVATAQTVETMPIDQIKDCLCQQRQLDADNARLKAASDARSQREQELQSTEQELAELQRAAVPGDAQAVAKAHSLLDRRDLLRHQLRQESGPQRQFLTEHNQRVERYNATCTKLPMLSFDITTASENLSCPAP